MLPAYCKVRSATMDWLKIMSCQRRLFANNYGEYHELNPLEGEYSYMQGVVKAMILQRELFVLMGENYQPTKVGGE